MNGSSETSFVGGGDADLSSTGSQRGAPTGRGNRVTLEVVPARSLGKFHLGTPANAVLQHLHQTGEPSFAVVTEHAYGGAIRRVVIDRLCLMLHFHPRTQLLESIRVTNLSQLELEHKEGALCGRGATPTFVRLYELLGPTFAGNLNPATGEYVLSYPGLDVIFRIPQEYRSSFADGTHPITLPNGTTPVALEFNIREDKPGSLSAPAAGPLAHLVQPWGDAMVAWGEGVEFRRWQQQVPSAEVSAPVAVAKVGFSSTVQDVLARFGPPSTWMFKDDGRMTASASGGGPTQSPLLFALGYPNHGVDCFFSAVSGTLEKVVLHTGARHHDSFLHYLKSHFTLSVTGRVAGSLLASKQQGPVTDRAPIRVTPDTKWRTLLNFIQECCPDDQLPRPLLAAAAEGTLEIWAMNGLVVTVVQQTDTIATLTIVKPSLPNLPRATGVAQSPSMPISLSPAVSAPSSKRPSPSMNPVAPPPPRCHSPGPEPQLLPSALAVRTAAPPPSHEQRFSPPPSLFDDDSDSRAVPSSRQERSRAPMPKPSTADDFDDLGDEDDFAVAQPIASSQPAKESAPPAENVKTSPSAGPPHPRASHLYVDPLAFTPVVPAVKTWGGRGGVVQQQATTDLDAAIGVALAPALRFPSIERAGEALGIAPQPPSRVSSAGDVLGAGDVSEKSMQSRTQTFEADLPSPTHVAATMTILGSRGDPLDIGTYFTSAVAEPTAFDDDAEDDKARLEPDAVTGPPIFDETDTSSDEKEVRGASGARANISLGVSPLLSASAPPSDLAGLQPLTLRNAVSRPSNGRSESRTPRGESDLTPALTPEAAGTSPAMDETDAAPDADDDATPPLTTTPGGGINLGVKIAPKPSAKKGKGKKGGKR